MTLTQMRYFYEVCKWRSITKAAASLHISQPTVSIAMADLEKELQKCEPDAIKLIVVDSVFSMEGDLANLPEIVRLKKKYNAPVVTPASLQMFRREAFIYPFSRNSLPAHSKRCFLVSLFSFAASFFIVIFRSIVFTSVHLFT